MESNEQIFLDQQEDDNSKYPQEIKYIHNTQSEDYINQFLQDEASYSFLIDKHQSAPLYLSQIRQLHEEEQENKENHNKRHKKEKSLFHNFQKHLVISLKNIFKIRNAEPHEIVPKVAEEMWKIFLKSHLYTKTILHILYGADSDEQQCLFTSAMLNRFGYVDLFNKYSEDLVREAQHYLRRETVKSIRRVNIKQYLSHRRMSKSDEFEDYLQEFLQQLSEGPMKKRIPKKKKKNLKSYIKLTSGPSQEANPKQNCKQKRQKQQNNNFQSQRSRQLTTNGS